MTDKSPKDVAASFGTAVSLKRSLIRTRSVSTSADGVLGGDDENVDKRDGLR